MENNFEKLMQEIKAIVNKLEDENIDLEEAMKLFENGVKKINQADEKINSIKNRVVKIVDENNKISNLKINHGKTN